MEAPCSNAVNAPDSDEKTDFDEVDALRPALAEAAADLRGRRADRSAPDLGAVEELALQLLVACRNGAEPNKLERLADAITGQVNRLRAAAP